MTIEVSVLMDLRPDHDFHRATCRALEHAGAELSIPVVPRVVRTPAWDGDARRLGSGVIVGPGSPYDVEGAAYAVIRHARERGLPLLGT